MQLNSLHKDWLNKRGITDEVLRLFNITTHEHPQIGECIRIPYTDTHSKYRRDPLDERKPKYLYDTGGKVTLYGLEHITREHNDILITEGELDALVAWSLNIPAVSSTGGAMSWQEHWAQEIEGYNIYLCFDNDDAGAEGMVKVLKYIPNAKVIFIPEQPHVKDISDFVARGGDFHQLMATAKSYPDITAVQEEKTLRAAQWLPTRFHDAYIDANRPQNRTNQEVSKYTGDDRVLRAKSYPMPSLIEFTKRKACCPWHNEKTPSLHYYPKTNSAYCFGGCGRAYDSIDAYRNKYNCSFLEAVKALNDMV
jgi:DNA primase